METDIFCKIIAKEAEADFIMESERWIAIKDIKPSAPIHIIIIPKKHIAYLEDATENDKDLLGELLMAVSTVAKKVGISDSGYKVAINQKEGGGQIVPHLHIHLLGGKRFN